MDTLGMTNGQDMPHQTGEPTDQLTLGLALDDSAVFANYFPCDGNALALAKLTSVGLDGKGADFIFLWGEGRQGSLTCFKQRVISPQHWAWAHSICLCKRLIN